MQKTCTECHATKPLSDFTRRAASKDGRTAKCAECLRLKKLWDYHTHAGHRADTLARIKTSKAMRFERDPAYKRAFNLWGAAKRRSHVPPWVAIVDFVPVCQEALDKGPEYEIDHIIPLKGALVCGLHVPANVQVILRAENIKKSNKHASASKL